MGSETSEIAHFEQVKWMTAAGFVFVEDNTIRGEVTWRSPVKYGVALVGAEVTVLAGECHPAALLKSIVDADRKHVRDQLKRALRPAAEYFGLEMKL